MLRQVVVLVGGLGTRLGALTVETPKPMLPVGSEPFLDILLRNLVRHGFRDVLLLAQHNAQKIRDHYAAHSFPGVSITVLEEGAPAGTGGALREAESYLDEVFLLTNGDSLFDFNYLALYQQFLKASCQCALALCEVSDISRYGQVVLDGSGRVVTYAEKSGAKNARGVISGGVYIMSRSVVDGIGEGLVSLETDVLPGLVADGQVYGVVFEGYFLDIGLPESYAQAQDEIPQWEKRKVVFFDRDGTLNRDEGYTHKPEDLHFLPDVPDAIRKCNDAGRFVIVISNQAGIARGFYTVEQVDLFHDEINRQLQPYGAHIDAFYYCPHHPDGAVPDLSIECACRKPGTLLFQRAIEEWPLDLDEAVMIGDKSIDLAAAKAAGMRALQTDGENIKDLIEAVGL